MVLGIVVAGAVGGPLFSPFDVRSPDWDHMLSPPSLATGHIFGTDANGRDLFVRTMYGARVSLTIGLAATAISLIIGVLYGTVAGFFGGWVDDLMMRGVDLLYSLPFLFIMILLVTVFGRNMSLIFVAIGLVEWLTMARIVRGQTLVIRRMAFVDDDVPLIAAESVHAVTEESRRQGPQMAQPFYSSGRKLHGVPSHEVVEIIIRPPLGEDFVGEEPISDKRLGRRDLAKIVIEMDIHQLGIIDIQVCDRDLMPVGSENALQQANAESRPDRGTGHVYEIHFHKIVPLGTRRLRTTSPAFATFSPEGGRGTRAMCDAGSIPIGVCGSVILR